MTKALFRQIFVAKSTSLLIVMKFRQKTLYPNSTVGTAHIFQKKTISNVFTFQGNFQYEVQSEWVILFYRTRSFESKIAKFHLHLRSALKISKNHFLIEKKKNKKLLSTRRIFRF